jgi:hypothetical protein
VLLTGRWTTVGRILLSASALVIFARERVVGRRAAPNG